MAQVWKKNIAVANEIKAKIDAYIKANPKFWIVDIRQHLNIKGNYPFRESFEYQFIYRTIRNYNKQGKVRIIDAIGTAKRYEVITNNTYNHVRNTVTSSNNSNTIDNSNE